MAAMELASRRLPESRMLDGDDWFLLSFLTLRFRGYFFKKSNNDDRPTTGGLLLLTLKNNTFKIVYITQS